MIIESASIFIFFPVMLLLSLAILIAAVIYLVYVVKWVYADSKALGLDSTLWCILCALTTICLVIYIAAIRSDAVRSPACPNCKKPMQTGFAQCRCGTPYNPSTFRPLPEKSIAPFVKRVVIYHLSLLGLAVLFYAAYFAIFWHML